MHLYVGIQVCRGQRDKSTVLITSGNLLRRSGVSVGKARPKVPAIAATTGADHVQTPEPDPDSPPDTGVGPAACADQAPPITGGASARGHVLRRAAREPHDLSGSPVLAGAGAVWVVVPGLTCVGLASFEPRVSLACVSVFAPFAGALVSVGCVALV